MLCNSESIHGPTSQGVTGQMKPDQPLSYKLSAPFVRRPRILVTKHFSLKEPLFMFVRPIMGASLFVFSLRINPPRIMWIPLDPILPIIIMLFTPLFLARIRLPSAAPCNLHLRVTSVAAELASLSDTSSSSRQLSFNGNNQVTVDNRPEASSF